MLYKPFSGAEVGICIQHLFDIIMLLTIDRAMLKNHCSIPFKANVKIWGFNIFIEMCTGVFYNTNPSKADALEGFY
jgi:hypothetical protein